MVRITSSRDLRRVPASVARIPRTRSAPPSSGLGAGLGLVGEALAKTAEILEQRQAADDVNLVTDAEIKLGEEDTSADLAARANAGEGAIGFAKTLDEDFQGLIDAGVDRIRKGGGSDRAIEAFTLRAKATRGKRFERSAIFEDSARRAQQRIDAKEALDGLGRIVLADPDSLAETRLLLENKLAALQTVLRPEQLSRLRASEPARLTEAAVLGHIQKSEFDKAEALLGEKDSPLSPEQVLRLGSAVDRRRERIRSAAVSEVNALSRDHFASIRSTGKGMAGLHDKAQAVMDADDFKKFTRTEDTARDFHSFRVETAFATPEEMGQRLETLRPTSGSEGFADRQRTFEAATQAARQIVTARAKDPAGYALTRPDVAAAFQRVQDGTLPLSAATTMLLEAQAEMGVPARNRRVLSNPQAEAMVGEINAAEADELSQRIAAIEQQYGEHFNLAFAGLVEAGLSPDMQLMSIVLGSPAVSTDLGNALKIGRKELVKGFDTADLADLRGEVLTETLKFRQAFLHGARGPENTESANIMTTGVETLALFYMLGGVRRDVALKRAAKGLIVDRFDLETFIDDGIPTAFIPTEINGVAINSAKVAAMAARDLTREDIENFDPFPVGAPGPLDDEAHREATIKAALNGVWVTNETATGVILMVDAGGGGLVALENEDGDFFEIGFISATQSNIETQRDGQPGGGVEKARGKAAREAAARREREFDVMRARAADAELKDLPTDRLKEGRATLPDDSAQAKRIDAELERRGEK